ncbi:MAG: reverse transcriptase family protein, partial [Candidatus Thiodiazotropha taylori]|nr:reverse transcriptase family protein [Candidatus Thiodiazotropha taylori]MCW4310451.1 reverse transcriptase family protein [Candidatus Thiodiazotropha endolucinida]
VVHIFEESEKVHGKSYVRCHGNRLTVFEPRVSDLSCHSYIKSKRQESSGVAPLKNADGFIHSDCSSRVKILNDQFVSAYTKEGTSKIPSKGQSNNPTMDPIQVHCKGVLKDPKIHKATGPDGIPAFILKTTADQIAPILTRLYQFSLDTGEVPTDWRNAHIVPVFKKGEKHLPSNYRPVSLTSIVCKLLEHIVHSSVMDHFDRHRILTDNQHGFRARRSCETQLITTIQKIASSMSKRGQVDVILLDFAKAFDKVPHQRLLHKLEFYGVRNSTLNWIESFLSHRKQSVLLEGTRSSEADVLSGVPQGTVLGPLLFLAYINDLPESTKHSDARLFADDCLLFRHINNSQDSALLQQDLSALEKWEDTWQMKFHPVKCQVIRINPNRRQIIPTNYQLHGHTLEVVNSSKYLGVTISEDLSWKKHIDSTASKANKTLGFVRRNLSDCSPTVKSAAYTTMVRPGIEYTSTVWDPHLVRDAHNLEQVQRRAARFVHRNYRERTPGCVTSMVQSLGWESLQHRRYINRITMLFKIQHGIVDISPDFVQPNDQRTRGSQRLRQLQATNDTYKYSFYPRTISDWNRLPTTVTDHQTLQGFRDSLANLPPSLLTY